MQPAAVAAVEVEELRRAAVLDVDALREVQEDVEVLAALRICQLVVVLASTLPLAQLAFTFCSPRLRICSLMEACESSPG